MRRASASAPAAAAPAEAASRRLLPPGILVLLGAVVTVVLVLTYQTFIALGAVAQSAVGVVTDASLDADATYHHGFAGSDDRLVHFDEHEQQAALTGHEPGESVDASLPAGGVQEALSEEQLQEWGPL